MSSPFRFTSAACGLEGAQAQCSDFVQSNRTVKPEREWGWTSERRKWLGGGREALVQ
jgi:hypothetical protein